jgi:hypothetical protein
MDEGPKESIQLPSENYLIARDAFNGTILWKHPIKDWQDRMFPWKSGLGSKVQDLLRKYPFTSHVSSRTS